MSEHPELGPWATLPKEHLDELHAAIRAYLPFLEGKAGTGWCMHDRQVYEMPSRAAARAAYERLHAAMRVTRGVDVETQA